VKIQTECDAVETASLLMVDNHKLGVVLIWKAEDSVRVLKEVSRSQAGCSNVTFSSLCDSTCSKVNWQHMARESVKCCLWDQLMCFANDIGTWSCVDV
jgi:aryl carrier-like protein